MSPIRRRLLVASLILLGACDPAPLVPPTAPVPASPVTVDRSMRFDQGSEYAKGKRSTAPELLRSVELLELRPHTPVQAPLALRNGASSLSVASVEPTYVFREFDHYSPEALQWATAYGDSVYFRDISFAVVEDLDNPHDGDTWTLTATLPDGSLYEFGSVTYHSIWNGVNSCFVTSTGNQACGVTGVTLYSTRQIQCGQTGTWSFSMKYNGSEYDRRNLKVVAKVDEHFVPLFAQGDPAWGTNLYAHACPKLDANGKAIPGESKLCDDGDATHYTVHGKGCAMTSATMIIGYHEAMTDPSIVNEYLRSKPFGYAVAKVNWNEIVDFASRNGADGLTYSADYGSVTSVESLKGLICKYGPQELSVKKGGHFVVAFGYNEDLHTFLIHDPAGGVSRTLQFYNDKFYGIRVFMGKERTETLFAGMTLTFHSPVQAFVTDPSGRRTGFDARTGVAYAEIPSSYADSSFSDNDDDPTAPNDAAVKELHINAPAAGTYTVTVVGTGEGTYTAVFLTTGNQRGQDAGQLLADVPTTPGEVHTYQFAYDPASITPTMSIRGGFQGGGQRDEVDDFLTYTSPTQRQTTLPAGATTTRVTIFYGSSIVPTSFRAVLEGADVTGLFHPRAGGRESVTIPLVAGRNVLKLSVNGMVGTRTANDQDSLVFLVQ